MGYRDNKRSIRQRMQDFMSTPKGQTILNYAYNWGASIVIMGTLFKLIHLPGANTMLCVGMGTEVLIFFISAFDLSGVKSSHAPIIAPSNAVPSDLGIAPPPAYPEAASISVYPGIAPPPTAPTFIAPQPPIGISSPAPTINPEMESATTAYLHQLQAMTEMLARCTTQAEHLSMDTNQMDALNRNLSGINAIYEMQLRSVSTQIGTIDQVHEQTRKMARQIEELNQVYARMLQAMTVK